MGRFLLAALRPLPRTGRRYAGVDSGIRGRRPAAELHRRGSGRRIRFPNPAASGVMGRPPVLARCVGVVAANG